MPEKTRKYNIHPCVLCGYLFSDEHHMHARRDGGGNGATIFLCPNHHRYADMVQVMVNHGISTEDIFTFAAQNFDEQFNQRALGELITEQRNGDQNTLLWSMFPGSALKRGRRGW